MDGGAAANAVGSTWPTGFRNGIHLHHRCILSIDQFRRMALTQMSSVMILHWSHLKLRMDFSRRSQVQRKDLLNRATHLFASVDEYLQDCNRSLISLSKSHEDPMKGPNHMEGSTRLPYVMMLKTLDYRGEPQV